MRRRGWALCAVGWALFGVSLALPAVYDGWVYLSGWDCFKFVSQLPWHALQTLDGQGLYYSGAAASNLVFLSSPLIVWMFRAKPAAIRRFIPVLIGASFCAVSAVDKNMGPGFYAWILSFALVSIGLLHLSVRITKSGTRLQPNRSTGRPEEVAARRELEEFPRA